ncbi:MAG: hypothetical protein ACI9MU_004111, partial [Alphaproteobacteria bacterium]
ADFKYQPAPHKNRQLVPRERKYSPRDPLIETLLAELTNGPCQSKSHHSHKSRKQENSGRKLTPFGQGG